MTSTTSLAQNYKIVAASAGPVTTNGGITCDYVSLKNAHKAWIVATFDQAVGHATGIDPQQATAVDGTAVKVLSTAVPIWANEDVGASDALVAQTSATTYNVSADIKVKHVIFEIDPASLDNNNGFDCLGCTVDDSSQATNLISVNYWLEMRYEGASLPSAIID
ncbi:MAG: hypothetical protein GY748_23260 [Planctomycetaceae bacterium]|nr:hypothetical protein [Planctomycetaceae bacterium]